MGEWEVNLESSLLWKIEATKSMWWWVRQKCAQEPGQDGWMRFVSIFWGLIYMTFTHVRLREGRMCPLGQPVRSLPPQKTQPQKSMWFKLPSCVKRLYSCLQALRAPAPKIGCTSLRVECPHHSAIQVCWFLEHPNLPCSLGATWNKPECYPHCMFATWDFDLLHLAYLG